MNTPNILIVEDDILIQNIHRSYLNELNCKCIVATNGDEALKLCNDQNFDLIFMDYNMPGKLGTETTIELRKNKKNKMPIIAATAHGEKKRKECMRAGMNDLIEKPASITQFKEKLRRWAPDFFEHENDSHTLTKQPTTKCNLVSIKR